MNLRRSNSFYSGENFSREYLSPVTSCTIVVLESDLMAASSDTGGSIDNPSVSVNSFNEIGEEYSFGDIDF